METEHERELRQWADALAGAGEAERRAMGKAILMLLDRIETLRTELDRTSQEAQPAEPAAGEPAATEQATGELPAADVPVKDTSVAGLRERLGAAMHRTRD